MAYILEHSLPDDVIHVNELDDSVILDASIKGCEMENGCKICDMGIDGTVV